MGGGLCVFCFLLAVGVACGPCFAGPIPRPARRWPGPFEKGLREAVGIDLLALLLLEI